MAFGDQMAPAAGMPGAGTPPKTQEEFQGLHSKWMQFLTAPQTTAALLQFGASVMQPVGRGQSVLGNIGLAAADAGMAAGRVGAEQARMDEQAGEAEQRNRQITVQERTAEQNARYDQARIDESRADREQAASQFAVTSKTDQQRADAYSRMAAQSGGGGGGSSSAQTPRDRALLQLQKDLFRDAADADIVGDEFDIDGELTRRLAIINKLYPENAATMPVEPVPGAGGAEAGVGDAIPTISDAGQYMALPPGSKYKDPQGNIRQKPSAAELP